VPLLIDSWKLHVYSLSYNPRRSTSTIVMLQNPSPKQVYFEFQPLVLTQPGDTFATTKKVKKGSISPFASKEFSHHVGLDLPWDTSELEPYSEPLPDVFGYVKVLVWYTNPYNRFLPDEMHDIQCQIELKGQMMKTFGLFNFFMEKDL